MVDVYTRIQDNIFEQIDFIVKFDLGTACDKTTDAILNAISSAAPPARCVINELVLLNRIRIKQVTSDVRAHCIRLAVYVCATVHITTGIGLASFGFG